MKILVIQQKMIGDVLVSSIICNNLKKAYPNAQIDYMVYASTTSVLDGNPAIDNLILFKKEHRKSKFTFFKFLMTIRREKYDIIIDSYSKLESWITVFLSNASRKISYRKIGRTFLYTDTVDLLQLPKSNLGLTIERRLSLLRPLNLDIEIDPIPKLYVTNQENKFAKELLDHHRINIDKKTIMISIIGSSDIKTYPLRYMSKVVDFIADNSDANILFNYIPKQIEEARQIYDGCKNSTQEHTYFDVLGNNLREYIALMNACDLIIGNDGGAVNIAKALNKPSFIIFSPWIEKKMWATFEDGKFHKSVHLQDYKSELFENKSEKELKKNSLQLYEYFNPDYFFDELNGFLSYNLTENNELLLENSIIKNSEIRTHKLSVLIITLNEIENIESLIKNVSFADEVIVVDSFSSDGTVEAVKKYNNVRLIQHEFIDFSSQRNFALEQATHNWVLFIDGDERISTNLQSEIITTLENSEKVVAYGFYRNFYFENSPLKYSGYQTDKVFRLFNKNHVVYNKEKLVHETLRIDGEKRMLQNRLDHYSYINDETYKEKLIIYAKLRAKELYLKKVKPNFYHFYIKPVYRFLHHFIIRRGFLDGKKGYKISKLNAFGVQQRYIELKKLYSKM
jgi:heptosyltransferase-2